MEILEQLNRYNERYQRVPASHQPLIDFSNRMLNRQYRTIDAVRRHLNRTGLYDLPTVAETVRVLGLEKAQWENEQQQERREKSLQVRAQLVMEKRLRKEARKQARKEARKEEKRLRKEAIREEKRLRKEALLEEERLREEARQASEELLKQMQTGEGAYTYKSDYGANTQIGAQRYLGDLDIPFTDDNLPLIMEIVDGLCGGMPEGFYYSVRLRGDIIRGELVENPNITIAITRVSDDIDEHERELENHKRIAMPSDRYALINEISIFFERQQGGSFTTKGYEDLRAILSEYKIICPKTTANCGKVCLKLYKIDVEGGHLPIAYMRSKSPIPVVDCVEDVVDECILLHENHYFVVKSKHMLKEQRKVIDKARQASPEYQEARKARECIRMEKEVLVYDIESENRKYDVKRTQQIPVMLSHTTDGKNAITYYGEECSDKLIKYLISPAGSGVKYVYAFNGGNYDHILIRNAIIANGLGIEECRRSANSIIRIIALVGGKDRGEGKYGTAREIIFADLLSFTRGTLRQNFKNYGIAEKGSFDFTKINGNMEGDDLERLREYCEWDTCGSFKLYEKIRDIFKGLGLDMNKLYTLSQGAFKLLKQTWKDSVMDNFRQPKFIDDMGRKASIGGRTEVFKHSFTSSEYDYIKSLTAPERVEAYTKIEDYLQILDVVSQYPSAMSKNVYPVGDFTQTKTYKEGYLGIYDCIVSKPNDIKYPVCYDKSRGSYNLLEHRGMHTSVDIEQMRKYGYSVLVKSGVYWEEQAPIFTCYINKMFMLKQNAKKGTPEYEMYKTFINAVFGKCLQNDDTVEHFVIKNKEDLVRMYSGRELKRFTMEWVWVEGVETGYYTYTTEGKDKLTTFKLGHIGAFILSYSKVGIYDELVKTDAYYMDTDSLFLHRRDAEGVRMGSELGDFSDDLDGGRIIKAIFICKKMYYLEYLMPNGEIKTKSTGKGVQRGGITPSDYEDMLNNKVVSVKKNGHFIRNVESGMVLVSSPVKKIKINSGGRIFISENNSVPLGHEALFYEDE